MTRDRASRTGIIVAAAALVGAYVTVVWLAQQRERSFLVDATAGADALPQAAARPPQAHAFDSGPYRTELSGRFPPVLRLGSGDTVHTSTLDNLGYDQKSVRRSGPTNPQTGPFFVEGALPGDTLRITLDRIRLNRASGHSGSRIAPYVLSPADARAAADERGSMIRWKLDLDRLVASVVDPPERLQSLELKVRPFLGSLGVAPPGDQPVLTTTLGPWGGNLDYPALQEGTVVFLPVFHLGALLFVGDGHAVQGDGELTGLAVETSLDVTFTVHVVKNQPLDFPRAENEEYLMAMGIAETYPSAMRRATSGLFSWLARDYQLSHREAVVLFGTSVRLDIAEIVDPQIHIVAKIPKSVLTTLRR